MGKVVKKLVKPAIRAGAAYATGGASEAVRAATKGGGFADIINAGGNILAANKQSKAIKSAANTEAQASRYALDLQERTFNQQNALQRQLYDEQVARQEPFRQTGLQSQNRLNELLGIGANTGSGFYGKYARDFSMQDFEADPGYAFRVSEGLKSLDRQAAARGGLISGGALKAAQRYGQELASQEFDNAFNRYQINRANQLNPLQSLAGVGQTSVNALGNTSQAYGSGAGNVAQNYATGGGNIIMGSGLNQAGLRLDRGNVSAGQYGNYGNLLGAIGGYFS